MGMVSNGRRLKNPLFCEELKESGLNNVSISIEGYDSQSHDSVTQTIGSYKETISGIRSASKAGLKISTNTVIGKNNINDLERIVHTISKEKVDSITFNVCGVCLSNEENNQDLLPLNRAVEAYQKIHDQIKLLGLKSRLVTPIPYCLFEEDNRRKLAEERSISGALSIGSWKEFCYRI